MKKNLTVLLVSLFVTASLNAATPDNSNLGQPDVQAQTDQSSDNSANDDHMNTNENLIASDASDDEESNQPQLYRLIDMAVQTNAPDAGTTSTTTITPGGSSTTTQTNLPRSSDMPPNTATAPADQDDTTTRTTTTY